MNNKPSNRMPPLKALLAFRAAGRHLSFKLAAEELHLTASAVSHQVKNLEDFFGLNLFERKTRAIEFTAAGRAYFNFLDSMFARLEDETHQLRAQYGRIVVRLCVPPFFASELLLPKLSEFKALMPSTDVRVSTQPSMMRVHPPEADISILLGKGGWTDLVTAPLFSHRMVVACSPALKEKFDLQSFSDLNGRTLIVHEHRPRYWELFARAQGAAPPRPGMVYRFDSMAAVVQAAAEGHGVAVVSWPLSKAWFESGKLVPVLAEKVATGEKFYVASRAGEQPSAEAARLIDWIVDEFRGFG